MVADYYVNVNGKQVLYSSLDANLKQKLDQSGITQQETVRQTVETVSPTQDFYERDHIVVTPDQKVVSVPGRYAEQYGIKKPPEPKKKRMTAREKIAEKKRKEKEEGYYLNIQDERGKSRFDALTAKEQKQFFRAVHPISLAKDYGVLAPSDSIHFKTKKVTKVKGGREDSRIQYVHSPTIESNFKSYLLTGDVQGMNKYLQEIYAKEGPREAAKERDRLIAMGVEDTSLELKRQAGGKGTRKQRLEKTAEQRKSARVLAQGQKELHTQMFGQPVIGTLGATFDERTTPQSIITLDGKEEILDPSGKAVIDFASRTTTPVLIAPEVFKQVVKEKGIKLTGQGEKLIELYTTQPEQFSFVRQGIITDPKTGESYNPVTGQGSQKISKALSKTSSIQLLESPTFDSSYQSQPERQGPPRPEYYIGFVDGKPAFTSDLKPAEEAGWRKPYSAFGKPIEDLVKITDSVRTTVNENKWINLLPLGGKFGPSAIIEAGTQVVADTANIDNLIEQTKGSLKRGEWKYVKELGTVVFETGKFESQHKTIEPPKTLTDTAIEGIASGKSQGEVLSELGGYTKQYGVGTVAGAALPFVFLPWKQVGKGAVALSPIKKLTLPALGAEGKTINLVTKLQLGYGVKRLDLLGKYGEGGKYFLGKGNPLFTPLQKVKGVSGQTSSFDVYQVSQYDKPRVKELTRIATAFEPQKEFETKTILRDIAGYEDLREASRKTIIEYNKLLESKDWLKEQPKPLVTPKQSDVEAAVKKVAVEFGKQQSVGILEEVKGSTILNQLTGAAKDVQGKSKWPIIDILTGYQQVKGKVAKLSQLKTVTHDIDTTASSELKKLLSQQRFEKLDIGKGLGLFRTKSGVVLGEIDPKKPQWVGSLTEPTSMKKGKFVRGDAFKHIQKLEGDYSYFLGSPRAKLWLTPNKSVTKIGTKKSIKAGETPGKAYVEVDPEKIFRFEKLSAKEQSLLVDEDYLKFQSNLEEAAKKAGKGAYTKPYMSLNPKAPKYETVVFDPKIIKNIKNIPPTRFGMKKGSELSEINIIGPGDEIQSSVKGLNVEKAFGYKKPSGSFTQTIKGDKQKVEFGDFYKQGGSIKEATSGIVDAETFVGHSQYTPEMVNKIMGGYRLRAGMGKPQRVIKDKVRGFLFVDRTLAEAAWKTGNIKLAKKIGARMGETFRREDWITPKMYQDLIKSPPKMNKLKVPKSTLDKIGSTISKTNPLPVKPQIKTEPPKKSSYILSSKKQSRLSLKSSKSASKLSSKSPSFKSPSVKSLLSPKSPSSKSQSIKSMMSSKSPSFKSPSVKSMLSPKSSSFKSPSVKSLLSPKSPSPKSSKAPSPKSPKSPTFKSRSFTPSKSPSFTPSKTPSLKPSKAPSTSSTVPPSTFITTSKTPPPVGLVFELKSKKKKKKSKAGDDTDPFLGSTWEESVLGFRSKKFDITYNKKSITRLLGEERKKFKRSEFGLKGKSSISKGKAIKLKDRYSKVSLI